MEFENFSIIKQIGEGGFSRVYEGVVTITKDNLIKNQLVAIKVMRKEHLEVIKREVAVSNFINFTEIFSVVGR